ncbi:aspartate aminotransferase : Aspartate/tyrosine/aromatic aminotransferase OS=Singulisphaera acidiphila (strain ATCC BAA-1392 / DSM 18658 / VKM B-2454 / MOB10) GN=Sinac_3297 PE=3 SV=1: Aminotran_1_2 [Gemmataceae bacterium]|nr:aspartate aminotransferase : Aspartate/tyrosine/aromatic aminotransferase OS=Singulisphaera acidiphila (strain ATCC BAA-1392 / DSM 18658 / VKM B-2454 / MOB10) GN=Sinac_3297 PE=3 SV=1: Aminotran_1_2 [Gemmataceae bacterium]VTU01372.1 aspartate aminotransferase : Aspartate/tyrosine/aromatic aminotransferase OS=Singulisphaera acidiphila (strain ATCC BAA-1392 / DSM 18658 / VKM B-2454 / MOB10) GN=Sinac_3297 PE=3 SV=1: Aminotran_1_2 [Gemmataceae bacterium]
MFPESLLADRTRAVEISGIRKIFELGKSLKDPVNLSIGQPHFDVPESVKAAAKAAIDGGQNGYVVTQGVPQLRDKLVADAAARFPGQDRDVLVTSGTSGGLLLALFAVVNPGDEVVTPDPYFVSYPNMVALAGGKLVTVDTYPDFRVDPDKVRAAITPRTKAILISTPSNPTGAVVDPATQKALADLARERGVLLISDEIYRAFHCDGPPHSPAAFDPNVLVVEGFGKTYGMTGWRLGWAHGPKRLVQEMAKMQQFTFVCAPSVVQWGGAAALDFDVTGIVADYARKRDLLAAGLRGHYDFELPGGAFYLFPRAPWGTGTEFAAAGIAENLLVIPGGVFSARDTHFRISYAASDETLHRGIEILKRMAKR